mmetsp:Transcript_56844/g.133535  ORF Transcript_56844/g.133535 Transcript_56844/m.133535 type:complete len:1039 (-) Transcript_56844:105-3221(-)
MQIERTASSASAAASGTSASPSPLLKAVERSERRLRADIANLNEELHRGLQDIQKILGGAPNSILSDKIFKSKESAKLRTSGNSVDFDNPEIVTSPPGSTASFGPGFINDGLPKRAAQSAHLSRGFSAVTLTRQRSKDETNASESWPNHTMNVNQAGKLCLHGRWEGWSASLSLRQELASAYEEDNLTKLKDLAGFSAGRNITVSSTFETGRLMSHLHVIDPGSKKHMIFDFLCLLMVTLQLFYLPFAITWEEEVDGIDRYVLIITSSFWILDTSLHFITGYHTGDGEVEARFTYVVHHYLRTWFIVDLLCVITDVVNLATTLAEANTRAGATRVLHVVKIQRILRAIVMIRMMRVAKVVHDYMESQLTLTWTVIVRTMQIALFILWLAHVLACVWYGIGQWAPTGSTGQRWINTPVPGTEHLLISESGIAYKYTSAYHWSLAQITLGGLDINPVNSWERSLAIVCNCFGLLFGGTLVSVLATTMIELRELNHDREVKMRKLREFLLQHGVNIGIRLRVVHQVHERIKQHGRALVENDVAALAAVPAALLRGLRYDLFKRNVLQHPLLHAWMLLAEDSLRYLCSEGTKLIVLLPDDELFTSGQESKSAFFLRDGSLSYTMSPADGLVSKEEQTEVSNGNWMSEATWWCYWYHVGTASADVSCTLVAVTAEAVLDSMMKDPYITAITLEYGVRFHKFIITAEDMPVTDVNVQYADFNGLLCSLPTEVHVIMGMAALQWLVATGQAKGLDLKVLEEEVREGRSLVMLDHNGSLHRRVAVTVVQLENEESERLVQIAQYDYFGKTWSPEARLPGVKQKTAQVPMEAFQQIVASRMSELVGLLMPSDMRTTCEESDSKQFTGVGTVYVKTSCIVPLTAEISAKLSMSEYDIKLQKASTWINHADTTGTSSSTAAMVFSVFDDFADRIYQVGKVYILEGPTYTGLYLWLSPEDFQRLKRNDELLADLVETISHELGELDLKRNPSEEDIEVEEIRTCYKSEIAPVPSERFAYVDGELIVSSEQGAFLLQRRNLGETKPQLLNL